MLHLIILLLLQTTPSPDNSVSKNGMTVEWNFIENDLIKFRASAPSNGWIAIGLNPQKNLVGSNLIMISAKKEHGIISDRFVVALGEHRSMEELNVTSLANLISAQNNTNGTVVEFTLSVASRDSYHFNLIEGEKFNLTLAYSNNDDFMHHSAMRTSIEIIL